ncbi:unnamed protein product [Notodromas monacha]|uniref:SOCS box domain-containing protein n=1 Tax=Notodromas monacha TaxID=399045 RepID=A0A7R9BJZ9_9CRUS|nr:unnamed protein product [Notodromas monacha]CAG0916098.1 unnamed protein product [Notodromas monacha]
MPDKKEYDYLFKFLLVGDSDVGKEEILGGFEDGRSEMPYCGGGDNAYFPAFKTMTILLDGKRVKLQVWDASGQGRFCTILRSYSRGAQGILLVYDITNKWSFDSLDRWLREIDEHAPGIPKVLIGNRLHLAYKRQVGPCVAAQYAKKNAMTFFEISPLCDFNVIESFAELSRLALSRNGMERLWRSNKVLSLEELCCRTIVSHTSVYGIDQLPLPVSVKSELKSYAMMCPKVPYVPSYLSNGAGRSSKKFKLPSGSSPKPKTVKLSRRQDSALIQSPLSKGCSIC